MLSWTCRVRPGSPAGDTAPVQTRRSTSDSGRRIAGTCYVGQPPPDMNTLHRFLQALIIMPSSASLRAKVSQSGNRISPLQRCFSGTGGRLASSHRNHLWQPAPRMPALRDLVLFRREVGLRLAELRPELTACAQERAQLPMSEDVPGAAESAESDTGTL